MTAGQGSAPAGPVPTVRFLHASDVHVDDRPDGTKGLRLMVEAARQHEVDLVLLVGDTFDHNRVRPETVEDVVDALGLLDVPVIVLPGNHDPLMEGSVYERFELPAHVHLLRDAEGGTVDLEHLELEVWGRAHTSFADSRPLTDVPARGDRWWQVAMAHGHLVRYADDRHRSYLITSEEIAACDRDYLALGHWDVQHDVSSGDVTAWYSGSPSRKGACTVVTLSATGPTSRSVDVRPITLA